MHVVLFYSTTDPDYSDEWMATAGRMMEILGRMDGFIDVHYSKLPDGRDLAIAYFESEQAIAQWANEPEHRQAMRAGRDYIFKDYLIQVCEVTRSYTKATSSFDDRTVLKP